MHRNTMRDRAALTLSLGLPLLAFVSQSSLADVVVAEYVSSTDFSYRINYMPDLDQRREGLAGNGNWHCVPTSAMNLLAYAANHGFPQVEPFPGNWLAPANHDTMTVWIWGLGELMGTSYTPPDPNTTPPTPASGGTGGSGANAGMAIWLAPHPELVINHHLTSPGYTTNFANIAKSVIGGNIGTVSYGRYDILGYFKGIPLVQRNGGHAMTVSRCYRDGNFQQIWCRDPADGSDPIDEQSPYAHRVIDLIDLTVILMDNGDPPMPTDLRTMSAFSFNPGAGTVALIDGHRTIRPASGYSFGSTIGSILVNTPNPFEGSPQLPVLSIPAQGGTIADLAIHPQRETLIAVRLVGATRQLVEIDPLAGTTTPIALPDQPAAVATSPDGHTFVTTKDNWIHRLDPQLEGIVSKPLPEPIAADQFSLNYTKVTWSDATASAGPFLLVPAIQKVMEISPDLEVVAVRELPTFIPGNLRDMAVDPNTGRLWMCRDQGNTLFGILWNQGVPQVQFFNHPSIESPTGIDFDDAGRMLVSAGGHVRVFSGSTGGWQPDPDSAFDGVVGSGRFLMSRSTTNVDPVFHTHPRWTENIAPEELEGGIVVLDCVADLNGDDLVDARDLSILLGAWGGSGPADLDADGSVGSADLAILLGAWGSCG